MPTPAQQDAPIGQTFIVPKPKHSNEWVSPSDIAAAWLAKNPDQKLFHATRQEDLLHVVEDFLFNHNVIKDAQGRDCRGDVHRYQHGLIKIGDPLKLPQGHEITPHDVQVHVTVRCGKLPPEVKKTHAEVALTPPPTGGLPPAPRPAPPTTTANLPSTPPAPIERRTPYKPTEYLSQASFASASTPDKDGKTRWPVGSQNNAFQALSDSGLDPEFTHGWNTITSIAARDPEHRETETGQTGPYTMEGKHRTGEDKLTRRDDNQAKLDGNVGSTGFGANIRGDVGHPFRGGDTTKEADGSYVRHDGKTFEGFAFNNTAMSVFNKVIIPLHIPAIGGNITNPAKQHELAVAVNRGGLSGVEASLARVNFAGYNTLFSDEQAQRTNTLVPAEQIYGKMWLLNAQRNFQTGFELIASAKTPEEKQQAAIFTSVAFRDLSHNPAVKRIDSMAAPLEETRKSLLTYYKTLNLDTTAIEAAVETAPLQPITDMTAEQKKKILGADKDGGGARFGDIKPGQNAAFYNNFKGYAEYHMNEVEAKIARGEVPLHGEAQTVETSRAAWALINQNPAAQKVFIQQIKDGYGDPLDHNAQMAAGNFLHDMIRNPNVHFKDAVNPVTHKKESAKDQAQNFVMQYFPHTPDGKFTASPDGKYKKEEVEAAAREIFGQGKSAPIPFVMNDQPFPLSKPTLFAGVIAGQMERQPALFTAMTELGSNKANDNPKDPAHSDGRRDMIALLAAPARHRNDTNVDGAVTPPLRDLYAAFDGSPAVKQQIRESVELTSVYSESLARHVDLTKDQQRDNALAATQRAAVEGKPLPTANALYDQAFRAHEALEPNHLPVANPMVAGLAANPEIAGDAVLLTMLKDPKAFAGVRQHVKDYAGSVIGGGKYKDLAKAIDKTLHEAERYQQNPADPKALKALNEAVKDYGSYFREMVANGKGNSGLQRENAYKALVTEILGNDPKLSETIINAAGQDKDLVNAMIQHIPDSVAYTRSLGHENAGKTEKGEHVSYGQKDHEYQSRFFTLPTNKDGKVLNTRMLGILGHHQVIVQEANVLSALADNAHYVVPVTETAPLGSGHNKASKQVAPVQPGLTVAAAPGSDVLAPQIMVPHQQLGAPETLENGRTIQPVDLGYDLAAQKGKAPQVQSVQIAPTTPMQLAQQQARQQVDLIPVSLHTIGMTPHILLPGMAHKSPQEMAVALADWALAANPPKDEQGNVVTLTATQRQQLVDDSGKLLTAKDASGHPVINITTATNGHDLIALPTDSEGIMTTLNIGEHLGTARGLNSKILLLAIIPFLPKPPVDVPVPPINLPPNPCQACGIPID